MSLAGNVIKLLSINEANTTIYSIGSVEVEISTEVKRITNRIKKNLPKGATLYAGITGREKDEDGKLILVYCKDGLCEIQDNPSILEKQLKSGDFKEPTMKPETIFVNLAKSKVFIDDDYTENMQKKLVAHRLIRVGYVAGEANFLEDAMIYNK